MATTIFPTVNDVGGSGKGKTITEANLSNLIAALCGATGFVISGFTFGTSANLTVTAAAGQALIDGYLVSTDASLTRTLTASATNYVYLQLTRDASQNVTGVTLTHNTTGSTPADSILLGTATTSASAITAVDLTKKWDRATGLLWTSGGLVMPPGVTIPYGGSTPPSGWLECNGAAVSRTAYADLFAAIGTTWGSGDGSTTFNLPDLRGEFLRGWDHGRGVDSGRALGSWQNHDFKAHTHNINAREDWGTTGYYTIAWTNTNGNQVHPTPTESTGGSETRPRNVALMFIIKY